MWGRMLENASAENGQTSRVKVVEERQIGQHIVEVTIRTATIGRDATVRLVTPEGWRPDSDQRWPTLYLLHGGDDGPACWTDKTDLVDRVRASGVLAVLPDCGRAGFFTDWCAPDASGVAPQWETGYTTELPGLIESRYAGSVRRAVAGVSMGGYAALTWAAKHPELFAAAASYSGMLHINRPGIPLLLRGYLRSVGERLNAMWGPRRTARAVWAANDPYLLVERLAGTALYLSAGNSRRPEGDPRAPFERVYERLVGPLTLDLATAAAAAGVPAELSYGPGTHAWPSWRREFARSWPFLIRAIGANTPVQ